jgi:hypothetical protein
MAYSQQIVTNVETLEQRARALAQDEMDRAQALDQKTAGLIAAGLVLVAAGVAFASHLGEVHAGSTARTVWAALLILIFALLLASLGSATAGWQPQPFRVAIHLDVLETWATPRFLDRDPTTVRGELMQASIAAVAEARAVNREKGDRLALAFRFFAAAIVATVVLGSAVALNIATATTKDARSANPTARQRPPRPAGNPRATRSSRAG